MSQGVVLFTASTRSRQEIQALAAEARRLRPDAMIFIRAGSGSTWCWQSRHHTTNRVMLAAALPSVIGGPV